MTRSASRASSTEFRLSTPPSLMTAGSASSSATDNCRIPGLEEIVEAYYSYALTASTRVSANYQLVVNPAYATETRASECFCRAASLAILACRLCSVRKRSQFMKRSVR